MLDIYILLTLHPHRTKHETNLIIFLFRQVHSCLLNIMANPVQTCADLFKLFQSGSSTYSAVCHYYEWPGIEKKKKNGKFLILLFKVTEIWKWHCMSICWYTYIWWHHHNTNKVFNMPSNTGYTSYTRGTANKCQAKTIGSSAPY